MSDENLKKYFEKRNFAQTPEPTGAQRRKPGSDRLRFVIQKHHASHLHYDFRLEAGGTLKSWAVPKGPSLNPADKRLAMHVEDHPLDYFDFEGVIPKGNYGAGSVIVWDAGTYALVEGTDPVAQIAKGSLKFRLKGKKLQGIFALVKIRGREDENNTWLLIKDNDESADRAYDVNDHPTSIKSGRTVDDVAENPRAKKWTSSKPAKAAGDRAARKKSAAAAAQPLPKIVSPMLATLVDEPFDNDDWLFELKWDGFRALCTIDKDGVVSASSRNGKDMLAHFPELADLGAAVASRPAIIDGEVVSLDAQGRASFQQLQQRANRLRPTAKLLTDIPISFVAFDVLYADGRDLTGEPLAERKEILERILSVDGSVMFSKHVERNGKQLYEFAQQHGLEGIIGKRRDSTYVGRRSRDWVKIKAQAQQEFAVIGYTEPRGSRKGFGALLLGYYEGSDLKYAGHVGTGFDAKTIAKIKAQLDAIEVKRSPLALKIPTNTPAHWVKPALVAQVRFTEWTNEGQLRHPAFLGLRDDVEVKMTRRERPVDADAVASAPGGERNLKFSNLDKVLWPGDGYTKGDLIAYYRSVAPWIVPHLKDRPLTLERYPNGIDQGSFFEKNAPRGLPEWVQTVKVPSEGKRDFINFVVCNDEPTLLYLANLAALVLHVWTSRVGSLDKPDFVLFDLDPWAGCTIKTLAEVALGLRDTLREIGLEPIVKTTGGSGLHVVVPLEPRYEYEPVKHFAELIARRLKETMPDRITLERMTKKRPAGTVYFDYVQVGKGKTLVAPYVVRPRAGAPVSMPLAWDEVEALARKRAKDTASVLGQWTIANVPALLKNHGDPWRAEAWHEQRLEPALKKARGVWRS